MYGVLKNCACCSALDHLIHIGKYLLYRKALRNAKPQVADFITLALEKMKLERYIAITSTDKRGAFSENLPV